MPCGQHAQEMRDEVIRARSSGALSLDKFIENLHKVIKSRDISEQKLKNAAGLKIELKKFKGYESDIDIYTFRSSFKKLIEPNIQENLLADCLQKKLFSWSCSESRLQNWVYRRNLAKTVRGVREFPLTPSKQTGLIGKNFQFREN